MKLAVCSVFNHDKNIIANSIGNSDAFLIFDISDKKISEEILVNKYKSSTNPEIFCAQLIISKGVNAVVCSYFEDDAKKLFVEAKIKLIENTAENVKSFLTKYLFNNVRLDKIHSHI